MLRPEDISRLCRLARLEITPAEVPDVSAKLSSIVAMVDQLKAVRYDGRGADGASARPAAAAAPDGVTEVDRHELYQRNAPLVERDLYLVPKVIE